MRRLLVCWMVLLAGCTGSGGPIQVMEGLGQAGDLFFLDSQHGWVVGEDTNAKKGLIAASSDGGRSWELTRVDTEGTLLGVAFR
ncbi:MAG: hypothetical protein HY319_01220, partial [Armatimonadetes bacterium]|nr:hypothetical protein [Armatimonadota bacterium]